MADEKSIFKYLICSKCGYKKRDPSGKGEGLCIHDQSALYLSENWWVRVTHKGKTTNRPVSPRKRDAQDYLASCKVALLKGDLLPGEEKDITWEDAKSNTERWWQDAVTRKEIKQSTADYYKWQIVALDAFFSEKSLLMISKGDVLDYQTFRSKMDIASETINHETKALKRIYAMHVARTSSEDAPKLCMKAQDIGRVALLPKSGQKVRFLTKEEIKMLLEASTTPAVRMAALIGLNTALRKSNILSLTWQQVRLSKRLISLPASEMKNNEPHIVDIPEHLVPILKEWRGSNKLSKVLFPDDEKCNSFRTEWEKTIEACGFHDVTFHTLRHTFASQFLMNGGDLSTLSEMLGHSSIQITKDIYGHLSRDHKRKAVDQFAASFLEGLG
jgi:integrase